MKTIGIKLADGSFYPVLEEGTPSEKQLDLTTAHNNQTKIMVDLYRSANCSMEDAEYVDSLQIENLNEHPNGEPDISFQVSIDENNELSAKIMDTETGNQSNTTITLVSRTIQERLVTDEYNISDTLVIDPEEKEDNSKAELVAAGVVAGAGLLAAASAINKRDAETAEEESDQISDDDFTLGDPNAGNEEAAEATDEAEDFNFDITDVTEEAPVETEETAVSEAEVTEDFSMDAFDLNNEEPVFEEDAAPEASAEAVAEVQEDPLADFDLDLPDEAASEPTVEESAPTIEADEPLTDFDLDTANDSVSFDDSELPDFDFDPTTVTEESNKEETLAPEDDYSLPDFDDIPDTTESMDSSLSLDDDLFSDMDMDEAAPASSGLSFTGLYDTETELGNSADFEEDDVKKKTKVPVIICIVCAIICIIATLLVLFIIPSKYNLLTKKDKKEAVQIEEVIETPVEEPEPIYEPEPEPEPEPVPEAVEDEVIVIEKAEEVVPLPPPVVEEVKPKNITYKIKWGDTLWDIANTYYKNPWRYKYIARYNGIKDPDYIISGTYIIIPAE